MPLHHRVTEDSEIPLSRPVALIFVAGSSLSIDQAPPAGWRNYEMSDACTINRAGLIRRV